MSQNRKISVLIASQPALRLLEGYNFDKVDKFDQRNTIHLIVKGATLSAMLLLLITAFVIDFSFCAKHSFQLAKVSQAISILLCILPFFFVYISLVMENRRISAVIGRIQCVVDVSKLFVSLSSYMNFN